MPSSPLIGAAALQDRLGDPALVILDASWYLPNSGRDARAEFLEGHLPGAQFFDIDLASDRSSPLPHMLPPAAEFEATARALGISAGDEVVVADLDLDLIDEVRSGWQFFRDRRPDAYGSLVAP